MKKTLIKLMALVLTLAAVLIAVGLFRPAHAAGAKKLHVEFLMWANSKPTDQYKIHTFDGLSNDNSIVEIDSENKNVLNITLDLPDNPDDVKNEGAGLIVLKVRENEVINSSKTNGIDGTEWQKVDKLTGDVRFSKPDVTKWIEGSQNDIYVRVYQGANSTYKLSAKGQEHLPTQWYTELDSEKANYFLVFAMATPLFENTQVFTWGGDKTANWGADNFNMNVVGTIKERPVVAFYSKVEVAGEGGFGMILMKQPGDNGKLTGDIKKESIEAKKGAGTFDVAAGKTKTFFAKYVTAPYTTNDNVYLNSEVDTWKEKVFEFNFTPQYIDPDFGLSGTTAVNKTTAFVEFTNPIEFTFEENSTDEQKATARETQLKEALKVYQVTQNENSQQTEKTLVKIKDIQANYKGDIKDCVLIFENELDNTKDYSIEFKQGSKIDVSLELLTDNEPPVLTFVDYVDEEAKVSVNFNEAFEFTEIPVYEATDNRDGELTDSVYVPGEEENNNKRFVDPGKKGNYEVIFKVVDTWGNITEKIVTFMVE